MNRLLSPYLFFIGLFLSSAISSFVLADTECTINEETQFISCYYVETPDEIIQQCPVILPEEGCIHTGWEKDSEGCPVPTGTECIITSPTPFPSTPNPFPSYIKTLGQILDTQDKYICSEAEQTDDFFMFQGDSVSLCGEYIEISPPPTLLDAPKEYFFTNSDGILESFFCGGYYRESEYEDSRCATLPQTCELQEYSLCPNPNPPALCTMEYNPVCGQIPTPICNSDTLPCPPQPVIQPVTFSNMCTLEASGANFLHWGECDNYINNTPLRILDFYLSEYTITLEIQDEELQNGEQYFAECIEIGNQQWWDNPMQKQEQPQGSTPGFVPMILSTKPNTEYRCYAAVQKPNGSIVRHSEEIYLSTPDVFYCPTPTPLPPKPGCMVVTTDIPGVSDGCTAKQYQYICDITPTPTPTHSSCPWPTLPPLSEGCYWDRVGEMNSFGTCPSPQYIEVCENDTPPAGYEEEVITSDNNPFSDTNTNTLEGRAAAYLYQNAIIGGFPDGEFKGDRFVNRAEASKFITRMLYENIDENYFSSSFWDVKTGEWYVPYVEKSAELGLINGYSDGSFRPAETINTAELLTILARMINVPNTGESYTDVFSGDWFYEGAVIAQHYNLFPYRTQFLYPENPVTRDEIAIAIYQFLQNQNEISLINRK